jgi:hypothetical protein
VDEGADADEKGKKSGILSPSCAFHFFLFCLNKGFQDALTNQDYKSFNDMQVALLLLFGLYEGQWWLLRTLTSHLSSALA